MTAETLTSDPGLKRTLAWVRALADEIGPRRPTGAGERKAAERIRDELTAIGIVAELERFDGYSSFFQPYAAILGVAALPGLIPRRARWLRATVAATAALGLVTEGGFTHTPLSRMLSRRASVNLVATLEPTGEPRHILCLVGHLDTSRSGLIFHPQVVRHLTRWISIQSAAVLVGSAEPLLACSRAGRCALRGARAASTAGLGLLVERELRGTDVSGANDNASGAAVAAQLAAECVSAPLRSTRVVLLITGCEESGLLGMQSFLRTRDTSGWLFLNFDSVGGPATLRFLRREGIFKKWGADAGLCRIAEELAHRRPELGLRSLSSPNSLTFDTTPVLARGGRALTFSAQDKAIPNYHWPTDTIENLDPEVIARALAAGREVMAAIDRGDADQRVTSS
jgi:hypothetical protein